MDASTLCSGLIGAALAQVLSLLWSEYAHHREYKAVLNAIIAECDYNISIIDEILGGVETGRGSFKRLSVDYFKTVQKDTAKYRFDNAILSALSRLIVDMTLFNLECDYVFNGQEATYVYAGVIKDEAVCVTKRSAAHDITETIKSARNGVKGSLVSLKKFAQNTIKGKLI